MKNLLTFILVLLSLYSCQKSSDDLSLRDNINLDLFSSEKIERNVTRLSSDDAIKVARIFTKREISSRAFEGVSIKDVQPIFSDSGKIVMYAVNYADNRGYTIVGASKNFAPIIAFSDNGNIDLDSETSVNNLLLDEYKSYINAIIDIENDSLRTMYALKWALYEEEASVNSRSYTPAQINQKLNEARSYYTSQGYDVHSLGAAQYLIPAGSGQTAVERSTGFIRDICSHTPTEYDCMDVSLFLYKQIHDVFGPYLNTMWHQGFPYCADAPYGTAGCITIAVTQLMYYYKWPTNFDWNNIRESWTESLSNAERTFMNSVRNRLNLIHISAGQTIISLSDMISTFNYYNYNISELNYDHNKVVSYIKSGMPLLMYARQNTNENNVHVWVCDGYKIDKTQYAAYMIASDFGEYMFYSGMTDIIGEYFHMNLGLNSPTATSVWFYQDNMIYDNSNYTTDRKMYVITKK